MKIGAKIGLGFGSVMAITAILGITAFIMFGRIAKEVDTLGNHHIPSVQHNAGVERAALNVQIDAKNFRIDQKDEYVDQGKKDFADLASYLDKIEKVAAQFHDAALQEKAAGVRKSLEPWQNLFDQFVAAERSNNAAVVTRAEKGNEVTREADAYLQSINAASNDAREDLATVNKVNSLVYEMRMNEKAYMLYRDSKYLDLVNKNLSALQDCYAALEKSTPSPDEQKLITSARKATQDYADASKKMAEIFKTTESGRNDTDKGAVSTVTETMNHAGDAVIAATTSFQVLKSQQEEKVAKAADIVAEINKTIIFARYKNLSYGDSRDLKDWNAVEDSIAKLGKLYGELRKVSLTKEDLDRIDRAEKATTDYQATSLRWKETDDNVQINTAPALRKMAAQATAAAEAAEADALKASSDSSTNVRSIVSSSKLIAILSLLAGIAIGVGVSIYITLSITRPTVMGVNFAKSLADGDLTQRLHIERKDELGELATAMDGMGSNLRGMFVEIRGHADSLSAASQELSAVSSQVSSNSEETAAQSTVVATAAEQVSSNIGTVATAAEELNASVREIAQQTASASKVASEAVSLANRTNSTISKLGNSSVEIGNVVKVITSIAQQTNLLALNATIEAARAGESGKGFAVVANEVKELARQTAEATDDIAQKIGGIQTDSTEAVEAIKEIGKIISQIDSIQTSIAGAVEEQAATTNEISRNVNEAAIGSAEIAKNIISVADVAKNSTQAAANTASAATKLAQLAADLTQGVQQFKLDSNETPVKKAAAPAARPAAAPPVAKRNGHNGNGTNHHEIDRSERPAEAGVSMTNRFR